MRRTGQRAAQLVRTIFIQRGNQALYRDSWRFRLKRDIVGLAFESVRKNDSKTQAGVNSFSLLFSVSVAFKS